MNRDGFDVNDSPSSTNSAERTTTRAEDEQEEPRRSPAGQELRLLLERRAELEREIQRVEKSISSRLPTLTPPLYDRASLVGASSAQQASQLTASALVESLSVPLSDRSRQVPSVSQTDASSSRMGYRHYYSPSIYSQTTGDTRLGYDSTKNPAKLSPKELTSQRTRPRLDEEKHHEDDDSRRDDVAKPRSLASSTRASSSFALPPRKGEARTMRPPKLVSFKHLWDNILEDEHKTDSSSKPTNTDKQRRTMERFQKELHYGKVVLKEEQDKSITGRYRRPSRNKRKNAEQQEPNQQDESKKQKGS